MMRCDFVWSDRVVGAMPGRDLRRCGLGGCFLVPVPPQEPYGDGHVESDAREGEERDVRWALR